MNKGLFIVFEGGEGSGKSSIAQMVVDYLNDNDIPSILTQDPNKTLPATKQLREFILNSDYEIDKFTETLLFGAARNELIKNVIEPALSEGKIVICDRFLLSNLVYQSTNGVDIQKIEKLNSLIIPYNLYPNLNIFFDIEPQIGLDRISKNSDREVNNYDEKSLDYHNKIRERYLELVNDLYYYESVVIDASKSLEEVFEDVKNIVLNLIQYLNK